MLSDEAAYLVMAEIAYLTEQANLYNDAKANATLNHLTELHRLRDEIVVRRLMYELKENYSPWSICNTLMELHNA